MNWNPLTWLRSTDDGKDSKDDDSSYEDEVQDRCDHDWERGEVENATSFLGTPTDISPGWNRIYAPKFTKGFAVFTVFTEQAKFCTKCGEKKTGSTTPLKDGKVAIPVAYRIEDGVTLEEALTEEVSPEADYEVSPDGETTAVEDDEDGRIIVSERSFEPDDTDENAADKPVAAGGATD